MAKKYSYKVIGEQVITLLPWNITLIPGHTVHTDVNLDGYLETHLEKIVAAPVTTAPVKETTEPEVTKTTEEAPQKPARKSKKASE